MKVKMSMKQAHSGARCVACAGYCTMHYLLSGESPFAYNAGLYGWNNDSYYVIDRIGRSWVISTGYRNMQAEHLPYDIVERYEKQAAALQSIDERRALLRDMLSHIMNV